MFFASQVSTSNRYELVVNASTLADELGFRAVWLPERHFRDFGGLFPNPAVMAAALSLVTQRIELRAGSVITPLHDVLRVAEEWSVVDNLSGGRVAVSVGSGWNADDFVLAPENYTDRRAVMREQLTQLRALWRGEPVARRNGTGHTVDVTIQPRPVQPELRAWATSAGSPETFRWAGEAGANVLTHLVGQDLSALAENIALYRAALRDAGAPGPGTVTLMVHTYLGAEGEDVRAQVHHPLRDYLRSAVSLQGSDMVRRGQVSADEVEAEQALLDELLDLTVDRYYEQSALLGDADKIAQVVDRAAAAGVDEIACLIDFGLPTGAVLDGLKRFASHFIPA